MLKKVLIFGVVMILALSFTACEFDSGLENYKQAAKDGIQLYADGKGENNYTDENWEKIQKAVTDGKEAIESATTESQVDSAAKSAEDAIDEVIKEGIGMFYTLQEAYDEGWLTMQDLMSIAYYHGSLGGVIGTFIPTPKNPESLSTEVTNEICRIFFAIYIEPNNVEGSSLSNENLTLDDVAISAYYGIYSDCVTVRMKDNYGILGGISYYYVADVRFSDNGGNPIMIWKDGRGN